MVAAGGTVPLGYYKDPEKSAQTFRVIDGVRYSFPGDWATVEADGTLTLLGRGSLCINTGGEKVYPEEVEEAVKLHPAIERLPRRRRARREVRRARRRGRRAGAGRRRRRGRADRIAKAKLAALQGSEAGRHRRARCRARRTARRTTRPPRSSPSTPRPEATRTLRPPGGARRTSAEGVRLESRS